MPSWEVAGHNFYDIMVVSWNVGYLTSFVLSFRPCPQFWYNRKNETEHVCSRPPINSTPKLYPRDVLTDVHEEMGTRIDVAALFIIVKNWKQYNFIIHKMWKLVWYLTRYTRAHLDVRRYPKELLFMVNIHVCYWCHHQALSPVYVEWNHTPCPLVPGPSLSSPSALRS